MDVLNIVLNEYCIFSTWLKDFSNTQVILPDTDLKDAGKFYPGAHAEDITLLIDDDLIYPENYVATMTSKANDVGLLSDGDGIDRLHGTVYLKNRNEDLIRRAVRAIKNGSTQPGHCEKHIITGRQVPILFI